MKGKRYTNSDVARQDILDNDLALERIQQSVGIEGVSYDNEYFFFTKKMVDVFHV